MQSVNPKLLIALAAVVALAVIWKLSNPNKQYSQIEYWENATVAQVEEVPQEALEPGNRNGPVLMWAAMATDDPEVIRALVRRGADVNEADVIFKGTPLSAAAANTQHPVILEELVALGADVGQELHMGRTALMNAAVFNENPGVTETLLELGADPHRRSNADETAISLAREAGNETALAELGALD